MDDFLLKKALNVCLKLNEDIKHIRLFLNKIKPSKPTISINETDIIIVATDTCLGMTPHIGKHKFKRSFDNTT